ncbi:MAG: hypothetical protein WDW38_005156 [Sanguina aurantia]
MRKSQSSKGTAASFPDAKGRAGLPPGIYPFNESQPGPPAAEPIDHTDDKMRAFEHIRSLPGNLQFKSNGQGIADPGQERYSAPAWIPIHLRKLHNLPRALFCDPWAPSDETATRRVHAALIMQQLRDSNAPMTAAALMDAVHAYAGPTFGSLQYVIGVCENLRKSRIVQGRQNPSSRISHGHIDHPRLYSAHDYQQVETSSPAWVAKRAAAEKERKVLHALRRLRNGKPPYQIFRKQASFSMFQHCLVQEQLQQVLDGVDSSTIRSSDMDGRERFAALTSRVAKQLSA